MPEKLTVGARRSTLIPVIGPAVAQEPAMLQTWRELVEAFAVSVSGATEVLRAKDESEELARSDPRSEAEQLIEASDDRHTGAGLVQATDGGLTPTETSSPIPASAAVLYVLQRFAKSQTVAE
jgi:hypothetical protein